MAKEFRLRGKTFDEIKGMSPAEFALLVPARQRRTIKRGFSEAQQILLNELKLKPDVKTHCRDTVIIPIMVNKTIRVYNGKEFIPVRIEKEMLGHRLGEFAQTRKRILHSAPGIGATRSSASLSVR